MKIAITGGKGGTGKSMISTSLAVEFAKSKKTTLIDVDVECPNDHLIISTTQKEHKKIYQPIPKWDMEKCIKCGKCASVCKQDSIVFVKDKYPAFVKDTCIGCMACVSACPTGAISVTKKEIGTIYLGNNYNVNLITGELKIGELASGEVVAEVRKEADKIDEADVTLIDSAAGIGCPVIASLVGTDYVVAVTEPTPSALHDLKRVIYLTNHFKIKHGIVINKYNLSDKLCREVEMFAKDNNIEVIGKIPYHQDFVNSTIEMKPMVEFNSEYSKMFKDIISVIEDKILYD
jgi:MinD superfamily P-loop ATPase